MGILQGPYRTEQRVILRAFVMSEDWPRDKITESTLRWSGKASDSTIGRPAGGGGKSRSSSQHLQTIVTNNSSAYSPNRPLLTALFPDLLLPEIPNPGE